MLQFQISKVKMSNFAAAFIRWRRRRRRRRRVVMMNCAAVGFAAAFATNFVTVIAVSACVSSAHYIKLVDIAECQISTIQGCFLTKLLFS
jgi:hypothetical protein